MWALSGAKCRANAREMHPEPVQRSKIRSGGWPGDDACFKYSNRRNTHSSVSHLQVVC
jgi:hypothetical protein